MRMRKWLALISFMGTLVLISNDANAGLGDCRRLDYAELKDMPLTEVARTYCYYETVAIHRMRDATRFLELGAAKQSEEANNAASICSDELGKIRDFLKRSKSNKVPKCDE